MPSLRLLAAIAAGAAVAAAAPAAVIVGPAGQDPRTSEAARPAQTRPALYAAATAVSARSIARASWWGRTYTTTSGEAVSVRLAAAYPVDDALGQRWADFFGSLVRGDELSRVRIYIAPHAEIASLCGSAHALGCYGGGRLVTIGEAAEGVSAEEVATHEYGHHVAASRSNPPWNAVDWGTKRWASHVNVCSRTEAGMAFPGDEDLHYALNPGEAFAEAYRVLNETRRGAAGFAWSLADHSFRPDPTALARVEEDVLRPWAQSSARIVRGRFPAGKARWELSVATPLDGQLAVSLRLPLGAGHTLDVLGPDRRQVLARAAWASTGTRSLEYKICGERALVLRVSRHGAPTSFSLRVQVP